jgi:putative endonuclease
MTNNLDRRLSEHQSGKDPRSFTYKRRPVRLVFHEVFNDIGQLIYFEKKIKKWSAQKKRALADGDYNRLELLAECRNTTHYKYQATEEEIDEYLNNLDS